MFSELDFVVLFLEQSLGGLYGDVSETEGCLGLGDVGDCVVCSMPSRFCVHY